MEEWQPLVYCSVRWCCRRGLRQTQQPGPEQGPRRNDSVLRCERIAHMYSQTSYRHQQKVLVIVNLPLEKQNMKDKAPCVEISKGWKLTHLETIYSMYVALSLILWRQWGWSWVSPREKHVHGMSWHRVGDMFGCVREGRACGKWRCLFPSLAGVWAGGQPFTPVEGEYVAAVETVFCETKGISCVSVLVTMCDTVLWKGVLWPFLLIHRRGWQGLETLQFNPLKILQVSSFVHRNLNTPRREAALSWRLLERVVDGADVGGLWTTPILRKAAT